MDHVHEPQSSEYIGPFRVDTCECGAVRKVSLRVEEGGWIARADFEATGKENSETTEA